MGLKDHTKETILKFLDFIKDQKVDGNYLRSAISLCVYDESSYIDDARVLQDSEIEILIDKFIAEI